MFATRNGTQLDAHNVRRSFRKVIAAAGLTAIEWTPRELRHSFVSLLPDSGVPLEHGATVMDEILPGRRGRRSGLVTQSVTHANARRIP